MRVCQNMLHIRKSASTKIQTCWCKSQGSNFFGTSLGRLAFQHPTWGMTTWPNHGHEVAMTLTRSSLHPPTGVVLALPAGMDWNFDAPYQIEGVTTKNKLVTNDIKRLSKLMSLTVDWWLTTLGLTLDSNRFPCIYPVATVHSQIHIFWVGKNAETSSNASSLGLCRSQRDDAFQSGKIWNSALARCDPE